MPGTCQVLVNSEVREDFRGTGRPCLRALVLGDSQRASSPGRVSDQGLQTELSKTWTEEGSRVEEEGQMPAASLLTGLWPTPHNSTSSVLLMALR